MIRESSASAVDRLRGLFDRIPGVCLIETDAHGIFTHFGPGAEAMFGCTAESAIGKLRYSEFHDAAQLAACRNTPEFQAAMKNPGGSEDDWRVIPRTGEPFNARVTLLPLRDGETIAGWIALYRKLDTGG